MSGLLALLSTAGAVPPPVPTLPVTRHVADRTAARTYPGTASPTGTARTVRIAHKTHGWARDLRLVYQNETTPAHLVRASVQIGLVKKRVTFGGAVDGTVPQNGALVSDPIAVTLAPNTTFWTETFEQWSATDQSPNAQGQILTVRADGGAAADGDWTGLDQRVPDQVDAEVHRFPTEIIASTTASTMSVAFGGDSILALIPWSWARQWCERLNVAWASYARGGDSLGYMPATRAVRYPRGLGDFTHYLCQYGINDIGSDPQAKKADYIEHWTWAKNQGVKVIQSTLTPFSSSTDGWATLANQTPNSNSGNRAVLNDWFRDGAPISSGAPAAVGAVGALRVGQAGHPVSLMLPVAAAVESSVNSGKWRVDSGSIAGDGLHPGKGGHDLIAAAMPGVLP